MIGYYSFDELYKSASRPGSTVQDRLDLYSWFERYDISSWNGECFDLGDGHRLFPVYEELDEDFVLVDAEIR